MHGPINISWNGIVCSISDIRYGGLLLWVVGNWNVEIGGGCNYRDYFASLAENSWDQVFV